MSIQRKNIWAILLAWSIALAMLFSLISISVIESLLAVAFMLWIIVLIQEKRRPSFPSFFWPLLVYAALSLASSFRSVSPETSLRDSRELLLFLIIPIVYIGLVGNKDIDRAALALLASGYVSCLYSLFYFLFRAAPGERIEGFMGHYMTQAGLLLLFSCLALSMILLSPGGWKKILWAAGFVLAGVSIALTMTRSAWIGLAAALVFVIILYKPKTLIVLPLVAAVIFIASPRAAKKRALSIFSLREFSNAQRVEYLKAGLKIIGEHPLLGTGPDTVDMVFQDPRYGLSPIARSNVHLHNNFTQIAAERGLPALAAWLTFIAWAFVSLLRMLKNRASRRSPFPLAAAASIVALITAGFFEYNFGDSEVVILFLFMVTLPFTLSRTGDVE